MSGTERIEMLHAFLSVDSDGTEGVAAFLGPDGVMWPMIAADERRVRQLMPKARALVRASGAKIIHVRFNAREDLETIIP